jgi:hypothetical protein
MNSELYDILSRPLITAEAITIAFDRCVTRMDIHEVISKIPKQFGKFEVICIDEDHTYFVIQHLVNFRGKEFTHVTTHEFYKIGGVLK